MKILAALLLAALLPMVGCSHPAFYWYDPERTLAEAKADYAACQQQATEKAGDVIGDQHYDRLPPPEGPSALKSTPQDPGRSATDPRDTQEAWRRRYEQSVIADCMREKGYLRLRADRVPSGVRTLELPTGAVAGR
jgi:hypothetical protein